MNVALTRISRNAKTGPIPVSMTEAGSCPSSCPLSAGGCYAKGGNTALHWRNVTSGRTGTSWDAFVAQVRALPKRTLWRHNVAGDLPGIGDVIDADALSALVLANKGRRGFTYTHKPPNVGGNASAILAANERGFTVNLSANTLAHADTLAGLAIGPVVVVLPAEQRTNTLTPQGRPVVVCPAVTHEDVTCASCGLCQRVDRPTIIGFPAHGVQKAKASAVALA